MTTNTRVRELLALGLTNKMIAIQCGVSVASVKYHVGRIYAELGAANRVQAAIVLARRA